MAHALEQYLEGVAHRFAMAAAGATSGIVAKVPAKVPQDTRRRPKGVAIVSATAPVDKEPLVWLGVES